MLVSRFIGIKVFLNYFSTIFAYAPTKVKLFKANYNKYGQNSQSKEVIAEEILTKVTCSKRIADYNITEDTKLFIA